MKVHRDTLIRAIRAGHDDVEALREATRAGTGCGTCRSELIALLAEVGTRPADRSRAADPAPTSRLEDPAP